MPRYSLEKVKHSKPLSLETPAFTAQLFCDGKRIGDASNHGTGGNNDVHYYVTGADTQLLEHLKTLPEIVYDNEPLPWNEDSFIGHLFDQWLTLKEFRRLVNSGRIVAIIGTKMFKYGKDVTAESVLKHRPNAIILNGLDDNALLTAAERLEP